MGCSREECFRGLEKEEGKYKGCLHPNCLISFDKRRNVSVSENKKKYLLHNDDNRTIASFLVDGGMVTEETVVKCDNFIMDITKKNAVFVELKGKDLSHALMQILTTISMLENNIAGYSLFSRIVTSSRANVPNLKAQPNYIRLSRKSNIKISSNVLEESTKDWG